MESQTVILVRNEADPVVPNRVLALPEPKAAPTSAPLPLLDQHQRAQRDRVEHEQDDQNGFERAHVLIPMA